MARKTDAERNTEKVIGLFARIGTATLLMMWGVVNLVFNLFAMFRMGAEGRPDLASMATGGFLVLLTGLIPFVIGLLWLWKLMEKAPPSQ